MPTTKAPDPLAGLSAKMIEVLREVLLPRPRNIEEHQQQPELWVRMQPKPTVLALARRGLVGLWQYDSPVGGYRGRLTAAGLDARLHARGKDDHELRYRHDHWSCPCGWRLDVADAGTASERFSAHIAAVLDLSSGGEA